jgi:hypothetical protein
MDDFKFCFKENRNYVHGPDICDRVLDYLESRYPGDVAQVDIWMHKMCTQNMEGYVLGSGQTAPPEPAVVCKFEAGTESHALYMFETGSPVDCREPYPEQIIIEAARLIRDGKRIHLETPLPFTLTQIVVALNKALLQELYQPEKGKWIFNRLRLDQPFPKTYQSHVAVSFDRGFGVRLLRSSIVVDEQRYGDVFFSLVEGWQK